MSSLVVFVIPTKKKRKLANTLLASRPRVTEHDYPNGAVTREGYVSMVGIVEAGIEVAMWIGGPNESAPTKWSGEIT